MNYIKEKIIYIIREHYGAVIFSLLLTILIFAPLLVFPYAVKNEYQGINISWFGTDSHFYLTRGKEVLDGNKLGNPVLREGKNQPDIYLSYSDYLLQAPIKLLGLSQKINIAALYNTYNFIGVFVLLLLIYFFAWQLSGSKLLAITAALFAVGGYSIIYNKELFYDNFNIYARVTYPYISSLILFLYLNLLVKSLRRAEMKYRICAGLAFGLMFYIYFYAWSFTLALNAVLFLIFLLKKDFSSVKNILIISALGLTLGLYNLIRLFSTLASDGGEQAAYFLWSSFGHAPIFSKIGFAAIILFAIFWYKNRSDHNNNLILAIILSGWVALNQQIITGRMMQYAHYYWYFITPLDIVICLYMLWILIKNEKLKKYLFAFFILIVFVNTAGGQYKSFFMTLELKKYEQNYRPLLDKLNQAKAPSVILTPEANSYLVTIYTPHDLFWHTVASISQVPIERFKDALFVYYYLNKDARNNFKQYLAGLADDNTSRGTFYQNLYRNLEGYWSGSDYYAYKKKLESKDRELNQKREQAISRLSQEYQKTVQEKNGIDGILKKYGVGYIIWDKNKNPEWDLSGIVGLEEVAVSNNIYLYSLSK